MAVPVSIKNAKPGWVLAERINTNDGRPLVQNGVVLTDSLIEKLKNLLLKNIDDYYIKVTASKEEEEDLRRIGEQDLDGVLNEEEQYLENDTVIALRKTFLASAKSLDNTVRVVNECIKSIALQIEKKPDLSYSLGQYKDFSKQNGCEHSYRVAQFSISLANFYNKSLRDPKEKIDLEIIGTAALLHDFGTRFRDENEMKKLATLQFSEKFLEAYPNIDPDILRKGYNENFHTIYTYAALKDYLPNSVVFSILRSSEKDNIDTLSHGEVSKKKGKTYITSRIIQICNLYDSLLSQVITKNISLENVSSLLTQLAKNGVINPELTELFLNNIPLYSVGVRVLLSNNQYAVVVERYKGNDAAKPTVKTLVNPPDLPRLIDLRNSTNITITKIVGSNERLSDMVSSQEITKIAQDQLKSIYVTNLNSVKNAVTNNEQKTSVK